MTNFEPARPQDKVQMLKRVPVFASCTDEQLHFIADRTRLVEYKKGEYVYREGESANAFYIISSGRVRVAAMEHGEEKTLAILHNGDSFGEISLLIGEAHSASIQAINDALVLQLEKKDFDDVINKIPSLVLYLSRSLSKRLRTRELGGEFSEATIAALYSAARGVGRTSFAIALATMLRRETGKDVLVIDGSDPDEDPLLRPGLAAAPAIPPDATPEGVYEACASEYPLGFTVLTVSSLLTDPANEHLIAPLLSFLTNRFHYILIDLPVRLDPPVLKALHQADLIYVVTGLDRDHVIRTNALMSQLQSTVGTIEQRVKVILNLVDSPDALRPEEAVRQLSLPVTFMLPRVDTAPSGLTPETLAILLESGTSPYALTVRRVARQMGGMLVGLALGSGAALGLAHVGILKVIEREKIPIDMIAGSSIGALVAGLWASGYKAADLEKLAMEFKRPWDIRRLFLLDFGIPVFALCMGAVLGIGVGMLGGFWTGLLFGFMVATSVGLVLGPLAGGPIQGARLMAKLEQDFQGKTFADCWLPLKVVAANPVHREEVIFDSGKIAEAVRASVSIPGIFKPVKIQGKICLDGGVVDPVPVGVLKRAGCHHVIAVNVFPATADLVKYRKELQQRRVERDARLAAHSLPMRLLWGLRQELIRSMTPLVFDVIMRSMQAMEYQIAEISCRDADITLRPTVPGSNWLEFYNPEPFIRRGEETALQYLPELKRIAGLRRVDNR